MENQWIYDGNYIDELPEKTVGFVYIITNMLTGKRYIGKKNAKFKKTRQKKVKTKITNVVKIKKIRSEVDSDWRTYYGSSEHLKNDIESLGKENFKREIIRFCTAKGELSYYEAKMQFDHDVLLYPDLWYNNWVYVKVHRTHLSTTIRENRERQQPL